MELKQGRGTETYNIRGLSDGLDALAEVTVNPGSDETCTFEVDIDIDTEMEKEFYEYGGILQ